MSTQNGSRWWHGLPIVRTIRRNAARRALEAAALPNQPYNEGTAAIRLMAMDQRKLDYLRFLGYSDYFIVSNSLDRVEFIVPSEFQTDVPVYRVNRYAFADAIHAEYERGDRAYDDYLAAHEQASYLEQSAPASKLAAMNPRTLEYLRLVMGYSDAQILAESLDVRGFDVPACYRLKRDFADEADWQANAREAADEQNRRDGTWAFSLQPDTTSMTDDQRYAAELDAAFDDLEREIAEEDARVTALHAPNRFAEVDAAAEIDSHYAALERRLIDQIGDAAELLAGFDVVFVLIEDLDLSEDDRFARATEEKIDPLALPAAEPKKQWLDILPLEENILFHPRFRVWLRIRVGDKTGPNDDADLVTLLEAAGVSSDQLIREYLTDLDMVRATELLSAYYPLRSIEQVEPMIEALRNWSNRLSAEATRLMALCQHAEQIEQGASQRAALHAHFGVAYNSPSIEGARLELLAIAKQLMAASVDDFHYGNQLVAAYQAHQAASTRLTSLNVRLTPVSVKPQLKRYRFKVLGWAEMEVEVEATNPAEAKAKLRAEDVISGDTPQEIHRRYQECERDSTFEAVGETWCYSGIEAFWEAFNEVTLDQPVFNTDHMSVLVFRELVERGEGPERTYRFELSLPNQVTYKASIQARHINEAVDRILALDVVFMDTDHSEPDSYAWDNFDLENNLETAALFGMLTETNRDYRTRMHGGTTRVGYEII